MPTDAAEFDQWLLQESRDPYRVMVCEIFTNSSGGSAIDDRFFVSTRPYFGQFHGAGGTDPHRWVHPLAIIVRSPVIDRQHGQVVSIGDMDVITELELDNENQYDFTGKQIRIRAGDMAENYTQMMIVDNAIVKDVRRIAENHYRFDLTTNQNFDNNHWGSVIGHQTFAGGTFSGSVQSVLNDILQVYDTTNSGLLNNPTFVNIPSSYLSSLDITVVVPPNNEIYTYYDLYSQIAALIPGSFFREGDVVSDPVIFFLPDYNNPDRILYRDDVVINSVTSVRKSLRKNLVRIVTNGAVTNFKSNPLRFNNSALINDEESVLTVDRADIILSPLSDSDAFVDALAVNYQNNHTIRQAGISPLIRPVAIGDTVELRTRYKTYIGTCVRSRYQMFSDFSTIEIENINGE